MERQPVRVTIFHQNLTILSSDPADVERAAQTVNALMESIAAKSPSADTTRIAMLACLHLADRLHAINALLEEERET